MVGNDEVEQSFYGQLVLGKGVSSSLDEQLAKEARKAGRLPTWSWLGNIFHFYHVFQGKACVLKGYILSPASAEKQRIAEEVASMLKLSVDIDTSSPEWLVLFYSHICICKYLEEICLFLSIHYCCNGNLNLFDYY